MPSVNRVIIVPPTLTGLRNDYGIEAAKRYPDRFAVMGRLPVDSPGAADLLPRWNEQAGMLGVRITFGGTRRLADGTADMVLARGREGRRARGAFHAPGQLSHFAGIAEGHPQLTLIVDHIGMNNGFRLRSPPRTRSRSRHIPMSP